VEAGTFRFETWVKEGGAKFEDPVVKTPDSPEFSFTKPKIPGQSKGKEKASFSTGSGDNRTR
jgi:hypothetical protein